MINNPKCRQSEFDSLLKNKESRKKRNKRYVTNSNLDWALYHCASLCVIGGLLSSFDESNLAGSAYKVLQVAVYMKGAAVLHYLLQNWLMHNLVLSFESIQKISNVYYFLMIIWYLYVARSFLYPEDETVQENRYLLLFHMILIIEAIFYSFGLGIKKLENTRRVRNSFQHLYNNKFIVKKKFINHLEKVQKCRHLKYKEICKICAKKLQPHQKVVLELNNSQLLHLYCPQQSTKTPSTQTKQEDNPLTHPLPPTP
ncbi:unnamed protein product [Moneuplotes crassus]|uniref:Uncharacterized protein n=1 Tax=Euplotes crassus TaxID=5936 RepID=A0AAD2D257_EUPCR|nr:unnamed protein product [Moneuplotes crassus]